MRQLLDTHVVLWWLTDDRRLGRTARSMIADHGNGVFVSAATHWEISVKIELGKLETDADLREAIARSGFRDLPISPEHAWRAGRLPLVHRDPFDRLLVAQAMLEHLTIVTADRQIARYDVPVIPA